MILMRGSANKSGLPNQDQVSLSPRFGATHKYIHISMELARLHVHFRTDPRDVECSPRGKWKTKAESGA